MHNKPISQLFAALNERWGAFPNQTVLGSYDYFSQCVRLNSVHPDLCRDLHGAPSGVLTAIHNLKKILPVAYHEYAHWVDMNCTLYGLRVLRELALCYQFNPDLHPEASRAEAHFFHAKRASDVITKIRLPEYYSITFPSNADRPWQYQISVGHGFDGTGIPNTDPIVFLRFSDAWGQPIARQPLSIASILEANATYHELLGVVSANSLISDPDEKIVEETTDNQRIINQLYDSKLTIYSVSAHLCAAGHTIDIYDAYKMAAILSRFVLYSPQSRLHQFNPTDDFVAKVGADIAIRITDSIRHGNVESLFFYASQVLNWDKSSLSDSLGIINNLSRLCFKVGLEQMQSEMHAEVEDITTTISKTNFPDGKVLAEAAFANFMRITKDWNARFNFGDLHLPPCFMSNDEEMIVLQKADGGSLLSGISITDRFYRLYDNESWIRKFSNACYPRQNLLA